MKVISVVMIISFALFPLNVIAADEYGAGFIKHKVYNPDRKKSVNINYWYPTQNETPDFDFGNSKVFVTERAKLNADLLMGKFPVILLAHGGMRSSPYHSGWVASALAKSGYIVVVPQPPSPNSLKPSSAPHELWLRPSDLKLSLSSLDDLSILKNGVDKSNIFGLGFFLGGTSVLSLAGAKVDPVRYKNSCKEKGINFDCLWLQKNGVDLKRLSLINLLKIHPDTRIKSVIAINPELTKILDPNSVGSISIPTKIIALGYREDNYFNLNTNSYLIDNLNIELSSLTNVSLYSAFSVCTKKGEIILADEGEGDMCKEPEGLNREKAHKAILNEIIETLKGHN